eukprot:10451879-Heterocapsa_arctica.AAC.1
MCGLGWREVRRRDAEVCYQHAMDKVMITSVGEVIITLDEQKEMISEKMEQMVDPMDEYAGQQLKEFDDK